MAERPVDIDLKLATAPSINEEDKFLAELQGVTDRVKPFIAELTYRGAGVDLLRVDLPKGVYGEWVRDDPQSRAEMEAMGFRLDEVYVKRSAVHKSAEGTPRVADVVHYVTMQENKDRIDKNRRSQFMLRHGDRRQQAEEKSYLEQFEASDLRKSGITPLDNSEAHSVILGPNTK